ncbi:MAG: arginine repressor [Christensenellaceae bacterium]|jgi:transcriptional regulator of arginine metabolism
MKEARQSAILDIIASENVETQEELAERLAGRGFKVTQATISRDIKELHLIKVQAERGVYKYAVNEYSTVLNTERMLRIFKETVTSIRGVGNLVIVTTLSGGANAAAEAVDTMSMDGIVGSIAGDNTIFFAVEEKERENIIATLKEMTR